jgi:hypothetical protein
MYRFSKEYHEAIAHLVSFGGHGGDTRRGRKLVAKALRVVRKTDGPAESRSVRLHMLFISGQFPVK